MSDESDNLSKQADELEALMSIYGDSVTVRSNNGQRTCDVRIDDVTLTVTMLFTYPNDSPPIYEISAPSLRGIEKRKLCQQLEDIYADGFIGEPGVIYAWIECIREFMDQSSKDVDEDEVESDCDEVSDKLSENMKLSDHSSGLKCPEILTGECIEDRKSVFQPHFARVNNLDEVKLVIGKLYDNRKIANATHNMYAYRIKQEGRGFLQDCEDDGETHAGSRMLHLLDILNVENVMVVVSRWYGGIQLGPDRFKHINGATRMILETAGVVESAKKEASKSNANKKGKK